MSIRFTILPEVVGLACTFAYYFMNAMNPDILSSHNFRLLYIVARKKDCSDAEIHLMPMDCISAHSLFQHHWFRSILYIKFSHREF